MRESNGHCIAVVDVETTGLSPWRHDRIVEIAIILLGPDGETRDEYETLINPGRDIGPTSIHGLTATDVLDAPAFTDLAGDLVALLREVTVLAGHNVSFDRNFLVGEFERLPALFPELPLLCTCRLFGRQNLAACCAELGIELDTTAGDFHSALFDARATAEIVRRLLADHDFLPAGSPEKPEWPQLRAARVDRVTRRTARERACREPSFLQTLASRITHDTDATPPNEMAYLSLLDRVLEDRIVDDSEAETLVEAVDRLGISRAQLASVHHAYLRDLTTHAAADGVVTAAELDDLRAVASLLGIDHARLDELLRAATRLEHAPVKPAETGSLVGKSVCFTGELRSTLGGQPLTRTAAQLLAEKAGLRIANGVSRKLDLLVVADPNTQSGKAKKARQYGTRIIAEAVFWRALGVEVS